MVIHNMHILYYNTIIPICVIIYESIFSFWYNICTRISFLLFVLFEIGVVPIISLCIII